jgi:hypothetical protein
MARNGELFLALLKNALLGRAPREEGHKARGLRKSAYVMLRGAKVLCLSFKTIENKKTDPSLRSG